MKTDAPALTPSPADPARMAQLEAHPDGLRAIADATAQSLNQILRLAPDGQPEYANHTAQAFEQGLDAATTQAQARHAHLHAAAACRAASRTQLNNEVNLFEGSLEFEDDESRRVLLTRSGETENKLCPDKKINRRLTFDLFLDVQNVPAFKTPAAPSQTFQRTPDNSAFATTDEALRPDGSNVIPFLLDNNRVQLLPTIGFIVEF